MATAPSLQSLFRRMYQHCSADSGLIPRQVWKGAVSTNLIELSNENSVCICLRETLVLFTSVAVQMQQVFSK